IARPRPDSRSMLKNSACPCCYKAASAAPAGGTLPSEGDALRAPDASRLRSSRIIEMLTRPCPNALPAIVLASLVPFYHVIGLLTPYRAVLYVPELAVDRAVSLQPAWTLVYASLYVFLFLPLLVVRQDELFRRTLLAYLMLLIVAYAGFLGFPT